MKGKKSYFLNDYYDRQSAQKSKQLYNSGGNCLKSLFKFNLRYTEQLHRTDTIQRLQQGDLINFNRNIILNIISNIRLDILYQFYTINLMADYSEEAKQLFQERLQQQAETNQTISALINEARGDPKKYLPYGPVLMNVYDKAKIEAHSSALRKNIEQARKAFCSKKCNSNDSCLNACESYFNFAVSYGMQHFQKVHKYAYNSAVKQDEQ